MIGKIPQTIYVPNPTKGDKLEAFRKLSDNPTREELHSGDSPIVHKTLEMVPGKPVPIFSWDKLGIFGKRPGEPVPAETVRDLEDLIWYSSKDLRFDKAPITDQELRTMHIYVRDRSQDPK